MFYLVAKWYQTRLITMQTNDVSECLTKELSEAKKCLSLLKCFQTQSNKALKQEMFRHQTIFDHV